MPTPREILDERLARGEIDIAQHDRLAARLGDGAAGRAPASTDGGSNATSAAASTAGTSGARTPSAAAPEPPRRGRRRYGWKATLVLAIIIGGIAVGAWIEFA